jgi:hypothetical protein
VVPIEGADSFFPMLKEKVFALEQLSQDHPLSAKIAATQTKRHIVKPEHRVLLHDLVVQETERAYAAMDPAVFHTGGVPDFVVETAKRFRLYESNVELLLSIIIIGCYWGEEQHSYLWKMILRRLGEPPGSPAGLVAWVGFRLYPATLLMYAGGIAAIAGQRFHTLAAVLAVPIRKPLEQREEAAALALNAFHVLQNGLHEFVPGQAKLHTPLSDHLFEILREPFREIFPSEHDYEEAFHLFEYLQSIFMWFSSPGRATIGRARWRQNEIFTSDGSTAVTKHLIAEAARALFPDGVADYEAAKGAYDAWALSVTPLWGL